MLKTSNPRLKNKHNTKLKQITKEIQIFKINHKKIQNKA